QRISRAAWQPGAWPGRGSTEARGSGVLAGPVVVHRGGGAIPAVIALGVLFYLNWRLTALTIVVLAAFGGGLAYAFKPLRAIFRARGEIYSEITGRLGESLGGIRIVKAYTAEKREELVFARGAHKL